MKMPRRCNGNDTNISSVIPWLPSTTKHMHAEGRERLINTLETYKHLMCHAELSSMAQCVWRTPHSNSMPTNFHQ